MLINKIFATVQDTNVNNLSTTTINESECLAVERVALQLDRTVNKTIK